MRRPAGAAENKADVARRQRMGVYLILVAGLVAFLVFRAALETPSGEGVHGPEGWPRHEHSHHGP